VRAGFCGIGCRYDAKQGTLVTYVPRALAAGATLFADAEAVRVERRGAGSGAMQRVTARVDGGRATLTVDAPRVVLAGGAVGTPALLQRSALGGGAVGRWLACTRRRPSPARTTPEIAPARGCR
jgi:choline dehydrogenase-like flavoprotein